MDNGAAVFNLVTVAIRQTKTLRQPPKGFSLTAKNFSAKLCNEIRTPTYKGQKDKQSRKGQAESTAT